MIEITLVLFKRLFVAFGLSYGLDAYSGKEFANAWSARAQLFSFTIYVYLDTVEGFQRRVAEVASAKFSDFNKGYLVGRTEAATTGTTGRA